MFLKLLMLGKISEIVNGSIQPVTGGTLRQPNACVLFVVSNRTVTHRRILQRIPWKVILPMVMVALTVILSYLDSVWMVGAGKWDDLPVTSAWGLSVLINGPMSDFLGFARPSEWALIAAFWAWVGWLVDRRAAGIMAPVVRPKWLRISLYALGFAIGGLLLWQAYLTEAASGRFLFRHVSFLFSYALWNSPRAHLLGREISAVGEVIWGSFCSIYFANKLFRSCVRGDSASLTQSASKSNMAGRQLP